MFAWDKKFTILYFSIVCLAAISAYMKVNLLFFPTDLMIGPLMFLGLMWKFNKSHHLLLPLLLVGSLFAFGGDLAVLIKEEQDLFKIIGICSYVVTMGSYALVFFQSSKFPTRKIIDERPQKWVELLALVSIIILAIYVLSKTHILFLPSLVFAITASFALLFALNRRHYVSKKSFVYSLLGIICFLVSSSLTGLDFYGQNRLIYAISILFYGSAHYLISNGILIQIEEISTISVAISGKEEKPKLFQS